MYGVYIFARQFHFVYLDSTYPLLVDLEKLKFVKRRSDGTKEQFCILTRFLRLMGTLSGEVTQPFSFWLPFLVWAKFLKESSYCSYARPAQSCPLRSESVIKLVSVLFGKCTTLVVTKC